ncbi:MAG TPA: sodium:solute symporter [Planctomycetota bacterium]|nr:sodium:solute symporter [Planctomycetota bacterium]
MENHFTSLDCIVLLVYLVGTTALGMWLGRDQKDAKDYFVGNGAIPWWAILFSIVATETSALTFISIPGIAYLGDLSFLQVTLGYLLGRIVIAYTLLPRYYGGEMVTAYALLQKRFGLPTRRFASITFMATRVFGDSVRVFATAIPITFIIGPLVPAEWVSPLSILVLGAFTLLYTYHGGMRAVVWTDVLQTFVYLLGGIAALVLLGRGVDGGWNAILSSAADSGKLRVFDLYLGIDKPFTLLAGILGGGFLAMASHGTDQLIVQRLVAASSLKHAQRALIGSGVFVIAQMALFLLIGTGLFSFYKGQSFASPDSIFPKFIIETMPAGMTGLVIAAILAAAMSTVSGALNSLSAATLHDIYLPLRGQPKDDATLLRLSKLFTLLWAIVLIGGALMFKDHKTPVVTVALSVASFTYGGLLGGFFLGILCPRAQQRDAILGMSVGISLMIVVVFSKSLQEFVPALKPVALIAWPWYVLIGTAITFGTGAASAFLAPAQGRLEQRPAPETAA